MIIQLAATRTIPTDPELAAAFWNHVDRTDNADDCWLWTATLTADGYGIVTRPGEHGERLKFRAHRVALTLTTGPHPLERPWALHQLSCTSRACCNPDDLYWGTPSQTAPTATIPANAAADVTAATNAADNSTSCRTHPTRSGAATCRSRWASNTVLPVPRPPVTM